MEVRKNPLIEKVDEIESKLSEFLSLEQYIKLREEILKTSEPHSFIVIDDFVDEKDKAALNVYSNFVSADSARKFSIEKKCFVQYIDEKNVEHSFYKGFSTGQLLMPIG